MAPTVGRIHSGFESVPVRERARSRHHPPVHRVWACHRARGRTPHSGQSPRSSLATEPNPFNLSGTVIVFVDRFELAPSVTGPREVFLFRAAQHGTAPGRRPQALRSTWRRTPAGRDHSGSLDRDGARIWYATYGSGCAITLLHGASATAAIGVIKLPH